LEILTFTKSYQYNTLKTGITVLVVLQYDAKEIDFEAKIDTGASYCIFERKHAERLGIDVESGEPLKFGTATGTFLAYGHELTFTVLDIEFTSTVYFAAEESFTKNVLGQTGWLNRVKLGLIDYEGKLFLSSYNE
jgi:predicted aspartyl protease